MNSDRIEIPPGDVANRELVAQTHPPDWRNPVPTGRYHLVVIGGGTAGLVTAAGAAGLGARVALVERYLLGGDCLNAGCVPSKALLAAARAAAAVRDAGRFGARVPPGVTMDFAAVMARMRGIRARLSHHDSAARFAGLGVDVFLGAARFAGGDMVEVAGQQLKFKHAVIATGARAVAPEIPGLADTGYLTNETVFNLTDLPRRLAVIGGGPVGCELAQAFQRLGAQVVILHRHGRLLDREDPAAAAVLETRFRDEGLRLELNTVVQRVERLPEGKRIYFVSGGRPASVVVDEILVGAGRLPNVEDLNLAGVGVAFDPVVGVQVNDRLQTTNPRIYAAGDVCLRSKFTHAADFAARLVIQNTLFWGRKKLSALTIPRVTYTDPEIAHVGWTEADARAHEVPVDTYLRSFSEVDRAICEGAEEGFVKILVRRGTDQIVGATIVAPHAGETISEISVAMAAPLGLGRLAAVIHPYPTQAEAIRQCGDAYNRTRLTPRVKSLFRRWLKWTG